MRLSNASGKAQSPDAAAAANSATGTSDSLARVFSAMSDPTRMDLVARLAKGDATVSELAEPHDLTVQAISKHVKVLEDAGVVTKTRVAQSRNVHLEAKVFDLMTKWIERYRREAEERYSRLDDVLAEMNLEESPNPKGPIPKEEAS